MSTTSPIRKEEDLQRFRNYYLEKGKMRNYLLIVVGLNTALRIGDVLSLQWKDVYAVSYTHLTLPTTPYV